MLLSPEKSYRLFLSLAWTGLWIVATASPGLSETVSTPEDVTDLRQVGTWSLEAASEKLVTVQREDELEVVIQTAEGPSTSIFACGAEVRLCTATVQETGEVTTISLTKELPSGEREILVVHADRAGLAVRAGAATAKALTPGRTDDPVSERP